MTKREKQRIARKLLKVYRDGGSVRWTRLANARDAEGVVCAANAPEAVCFCLMGAAVRSGVSRFDVAEALGFEYPRYAIAWNDAPSRKFEHVLARLRKAAT